MEFREVVVCGSKVFLPERVIVAQKFLYKKLWRANLFMLILNTEGVNYSYSVTPIDRILRFESKTELRQALNEIASELGAVLWKQQLPPSVKSVVRKRELKALARIIRREKRKLREKAEIEEHERIWRLWKDRFPSEDIAIAEAIKLGNRWVKAETLDRFYDVKDTFIRVYFDRVVSLCACAAYSRWIYFDDDCELVSKYLYAYTFEIGGQVYRFHGFYYPYDDSCELDLNSYGKAKPLGHKDLISAKQVFGKLSKLTELIRWKLRDLPSAIPPSPLKFESVQQDENQPLVDGGEMIFVFEGNMRSQHICTVIESVDDRLVKVKFIDDYEITCFRKRLKNVS